MQKVKISERAVVGRINSRLAHDGRMMRRNRSSRHQRDLGDWFIVDLNCNTIETTHCEVEKMAADLSVLKPWEVMEDSSQEKAK